MGNVCCCCCNDDLNEQWGYNDKPLQQDIKRMSQDYSAMERFKTISLSTADPLKLIHGYLNEPLLPLEEALSSFDAKIDHLSAYIREAKNRCHYPSEHNLTRDESAAIYIYTMKYGSTSLYEHLHSAFMSEDPSKLKAWHKYLKLFRTALDKLPDAEGKIWQGTAYKENLAQKLNSSSSPLYSSLGSCSLSGSEIRDYLHQNVGKKTILAGFDLVMGKLVSGYTASSSSEVIVWPGVKVGQAKYVEVYSDGSLVFHLTGQSSKYEFI